MTTKEKIEVMQACEDGAEIETKFREAGETQWWLIKKPVWDWNMRDYRVKPKPPEPRRCWAAFWRRRTERLTDPWGAAMQLTEPFIPHLDTEQVQLIELTPEVIDALKDAGITYEGSDDK